MEHRDVLKSPHRDDDGATIHERFAARARANPDAVAVIFEDRALTYGELDAQADAFGRMLVGRWSLRPDDRIGLLVERSEQMLVAILGILKAGAAYAPIDPSYPPRVARDILAGAEVRGVVIDSEHFRCVEGYRGDLCVMDIEWDPASASTAGAPPLPVAHGQNLAYVISTSGLTGRRKGVAVEHRSALNTLAWRQDFYGFTPADVVVQLPSVAFDSSVADIFPVLFAGGTLVVASEASRKEPAAVAALVARHRATHLIATPTFYALLLDALSGHDPLRVVTVAGEAISLPLVRRHHAALPGTRLVNEYGPTEAAVCATATELAPDVAEVSIGRPIRGARVQVLDARLRPVGANELGEILHRRARRRPRVSPPRRAHGGAVRPRPRLRPASGCIAPVTSVAGRPVGSCTSPGASTTR